MTRTPAKVTQADVARVIRAAQQCAIFGWVGGRMSAHYTKTANRARLAKQAAEKLNSIPALDLKVRASSDILSQSQSLNKAMVGEDYAFKQRGGSMDFWDNLPDYKKKLCRDLVKRIREAKTEEWSEPLVKA